VSFSNTSKAELKNLNVKNGRLIFNTDKVAQLVQMRAQKAKFDKELKDLHSRLKTIYQRVNMKVSSYWSTSF